MKKIITAIGNPILNEELKKESNIEIIGNDIQYQEGIFEILEKESEVDFLILSELINGKLKIENLVENIKTINRNIKIIIILENKKEELENILIAKGIFKIIYNNQVEIKEIIKLIKENSNFENEELKKEINNLKKLIIENKQEKNKTKDNNFINQLNSRLEKIKFKNSYKNNLFQKANLNNLNQSEIISVSGPSGVGKSIVSVNLAKSIMYQKKKILMIDFDILNNSLYTILGVKKYPLKIQDKLNKDKKLNIEELEINEFIIKINKKIDLLSATDILFGTKEKIDFIKIEKILNKLKEKYNTIIIDTSSECFFDFTKTIIKLSTKNIFVTETNILEIKKAKQLLNIYVREWKIDKNKFNILFNKYDKDCTDLNLLKNIFCEFNIIGTLKYHSKYNKLINKNMNYSFYDKKIRNEYLKINHNI